MKRLEPLDRGKCPNCGDKVTFDGPENEYEPSWGYQARKGCNLEVSVVECPGCHQPVIQLSVWQAPSEASVAAQSLAHNRIVWPSEPTVPIPEHVPHHVRDDFLEAAAVLPISTKASAALSRRCLETVLDEKGEAKSKKSLYDKIQYVSEKLPSYISRDLNVIRQLGNRGAHLKKASGQILTVDPSEAQWNLAVLTELFDHYYVKPAKSEEMRRRIEAGPTTRDPAELLGFSVMETDEAGVHEGDKAQREAPLDLDAEFPPEEDLPF